MNVKHGRSILPIGILILASLGCASPQRADQGALIGGLVGAGAGALIGENNGNAAGGAALGAGLGALTGAVVGAEIDEAEARNRALIEAKLGRQISAGAVNIEDVVTMSVNGVDEELIVNHVRSNGMNRSPNTEDIIYLTQQGVSKRVIMAMQEPPVRRTETVYVERPSRPVVVHEYHHAQPYYHYCPPPVYRHRRNSGVSWGVTFNN